MNSLVSIIVPAYNAETTLKESIESLINQTYHNIEIIIIDDGSHDKTYEIALELSNKDQRVKVFKIENNGVSNARNMGITYCSGKYIAFMDSDDHMESSMIDKLVFLMDEDTDIVCCGHKVVSEKNEILFEQKPQSICLEKKTAYLAIEELQACNCMNVLWNKLFRSSIIRDNQLAMDVSISMGEDLLFVLDYLTQMNGRIKVVPDAEYRYTLSPNGLQANFENGIDLRISQLNRIKQFYSLHNFPMDGFYLEELRTIYILTLENDNSTGEMEKILSSSVCREVCETKFSCTGMYRVFRSFLQLGNASVILIGIKVFRMVKKIVGKSYEW